MTPYDSTTPERESSIASQLETAKHRPSREDAEKAVELLLRWAGDDPSREGLVDTHLPVLSELMKNFFPAIKKTLRICWPGPSKRSKAMMIW